MRQSAADRFADLARLAFNRAAQPTHLAAQAVDLIQHAEDQRQRLLVDGKFSADIKDQLDAGNIDLVEQPSLGTALRTVLPTVLYWARLGHDPAPLDPARQLGPIQLGEAPDKFCRPDHAADPCAVEPAASMSA